MSAPALFIIGFLVMHLVETWFGKSSGRYDTEMTIGRILRALGLFVLLYWGGFFA